MVFPITSKSLITFVTKLVSIELVDFNKLLMGNITTVLGCDNQSDALKAKQIELEEALERAELYKNEIERVKLLFEKATGRPVEQGILKTSESFRITTSSKDRVANKSISFSVDNARSISYGDLHTATNEAVVKESGNNNLQSSLRRLFRPFPKKDRTTSPLPPLPTPSPFDGKFSNVNGN